MSCEIKRFKFSRFNKEKGENSTISRVIYKIDGICSLFRVFNNRHVVACWIRHPFMTFGLVSLVSCCWRKTFERDTIVLVFLFQSFQGNDQHLGWSQGGFDMEDGFIKTLKVEEKAIKILMVLPKNHKLDLMDQQTAETITWIDFSLKIYYSKEKVLLPCHFLLEIIFCVL